MGKAGTSRLNKMTGGLPPSRGCWHCQGPCYKQFKGQAAVIVQWRHLLFSLPADVQDVELGTMFNCRGSDWEHLLPMLATKPSERPQRTQEELEHPEVPHGFVPTDSDRGSSSSGTQADAMSVDTEPRSGHSSSDQPLESSSMEDLSSGESDAGPGTRKARLMPYRPDQRKPGPNGRPRRSQMSFTFLGKHVCHSFSQGPMRHTCQNKSRPITVSQNNHQLRHDCCASLGGPGPKSIAANPEGANRHEKAIQA